MRRLPAIFLVVAVAGALTTCAGVEPGAKGSWSDLPSEPAQWSFEPASRKLGLSIQATPDRLVSDTAQIRLSTEKPSDFLVDVVDQASGLPLGSYTVLGTQTELLISLAFPRPGNYQVVLQGKLASDSDNNRMAVASTGLISVGSSDPTDQLSRAVRFADLEGMERALDKEADPDASMKAIDFSYADLHMATADGSPVKGRWCLQCGSLGTGTGTGQPRSVATAAV